MESNCPCKDCKKRKLYCHSKCSDYDKYRQERENRLEQRRVAHVGMAWTGSRIKTGWQWMKGKVDKWKRT